MVRPTTSNWKDEQAVFSQPKKSTIAGMKSKCVLHSVQLLLLYYMTDKVIKIGLEHASKLFK